MRPAYKNYKSFDYLRPDIDYTVYELAKEENEFEPYILPLSKEEEARLDGFVKNNLVISVHEHTHVTPKRIEENPAYTRDMHIHTGYRGLAQSRLDCVFENFADGTSQLISKNGWQWDDIIADLGMRYADWDQQDFLVQARTVEDILNAKKKGQIAMVSVLEGAAMIENDIDRLDMLYGFGVRSCGITYEQSNALGTGKGDRIDGGLSYLGEKAVDRMNALGILIELNHSSEKTAMDTINRSKKPTIISHTMARELRGDYAGKPDYLMKACTEKGGVVGLAGCPGAPMSIKHPEEGLESYMEHFEYIKNLVGTDHVVFGPDTMYGDHAGIHKVYAKQFMQATRPQINPSFIRKPFVKGLENPTECMENILRWLIKHNYSDQDIAKFVGHNVIRLLKEVWVR